MDSCARTGVFTFSADGSQGSFGINATRVFFDSLMVGCNDRKVLGPEKFRSVFGSGVVLPYERSQVKSHLLYQLS